MSKTRNTNRKNRKNRKTSRGGRFSDWTPEVKPIYNDTFTSYRKPAVYGNNHCSIYRTGDHHCSLGHAEYGLYNVGTPNEEWKIKKAAKPMYTDFTEEYPTIPEYNRQKDAERDARMEQDIDFNELFAT
jgi:hypothetical protein